MMINMFSFSFVLIFLIGLGINGQNNNLDPLPVNSLEKVALFAQLHHLIDNENQDQSPPLSCNRVRPNIKNAYPTDKTKYFICRDENRYEIFTCPNGGIFDDREKACIDLCEQKKPCLNQGQCIILSNLTLQCVCRRDWTGERCEIPVSTCANNPCGPNAECRMLKTSDYPQDYVCVCNNHQSYGRNCQQTVPNPCLMNLQQFHPFAFSRQAYINCDDELIFFQPCNAKLYWNQEDKRCDRLLPALLRTPFINLKNPNQQKQQVQTNIIQPTQWQSLGTQQWLNQVPNNPTQTNQLFTGFQTIPNQESLTNRFLETTTVLPKIFHLKGFLTQNSRQQNNANSQIQSSGDFKTQSIGQPQSWQSLQSQVQIPFQQNNQFGLNQQSWQNNPNNQQFQPLNSQSADWLTQFNNQNWAIPSQQGQLTTSSLETTTVANKGLQQGLFMQALRGWQPGQQGSLNQIDQQKTFDSIPTFRIGSWKA